MELGLRGLLVSWLFVGGWLLYAGGFGYVQWVEFMVGDGLVGGRCGVGMGLGLDRGFILWI